MKLKKSKKGITVMSFKIPVELVDMEGNLGNDMQRSIQSIKGYKLMGKSRKISPSI